MVWYAARTKNRALRRRFRRWLRKPRNRALYKRSNRRFVRPRRRRARRSRYNGVVRYKFSACEDVHVASGGSYEARSFNLATIANYTDTGGPAGFINVLAANYRMYRIRKVKVEFEPCQTNSFMQAVSQQADRYTGPKITWYSGILNWGSLTSIFIPNELVGVINAHPKKTHTSLKYAKRVFTPYVVSQAGAPTIRRVRSPWLATNQTYDDMGVQHMGIWWAFPAWDTSLIPGGGLFAGEGHIYYRVKYTIYVEFKYLFMNQ